MVYPLLKALKRVTRKPTLLLALFLHPPGLLAACYLSMACRFGSLASPNAILNSPMHLPTWPAGTPQGLQIVRWVYSIGFLAGTYTHARGILAHGFLATPVPFAIGLYWDTLTMLDSLTVLFLLWRPKLGFWLAVAIMGSDISVNTWVYLTGYFGAPTAHMVPLSLFEQSLFGLFVFLTAPLASAQLTRQKQVVEGS